MEAAYTHLPAKVTDRNLPTKDRVAALIDFLQQRGLRYWRAAGLEGSPEIGNHPGNGDYLLWGRTIYVHRGIDQGDTALEEWWYLPGQHLRMLPAALADVLVALDTRNSGVGRPRENVIWALEALCYVPPEEQGKVVVSPLASPRLGQMVIYRDYDKAPCPAIVTNVHPAPLDTQHGVFLTAFPLGGSPYPIPFFAPHDPTGQRKNSWCYDREYQEEGHDA